jgi:hypothetical protein
MKNIEMRTHLFHLLSNKPLSKYLLGTEIDYNTYDFFPNIDEEAQWEKYIWISKELKVKNRVTRSHGMDSEKASDKKVGGHNEEFTFVKYGLEIKPGTNKTDLIHDGESFASLKGGIKIQWGMHIISNLPDDLQKLFHSWISTFEKNSLYYNKRVEYGNQIINQLDNKLLRRSLINYYFRKNEEVPFLIVKDVKTKTYYRICYNDLIDILVDNLEFYLTKDKVKIVGRMDVGEKKVLIIFEIEPRTDKDNAILMHGHSERIIKIINNYKIDVKETYQ